MFVALEDDRLSPQRGEVFVAPGDDRLSPQRVEMFVAPGDDRLSPHRVEMFVATGDDRLSPQRVEMFVALKDDRVRSRLFSTNIEPLRGSVADQENMQPIVSKSGDSKRRRAHQRLGNSTLGFLGMNSVPNNAKGRSQASSPVNRVASGATQNCKEPGTSIAISQACQLVGRGQTVAVACFGQVSVLLSPSGGTWVNGPRWH
jgi:hypothetical protein